MKKIFLLVFSVMIALTGCNPAGTLESQADTYCSKNGGILETRIPFYNTNSPDHLRLEGSLKVCTFRANDQSHISVDANTLYTDQPTLAALAYLTRPPTEGISIPSQYCSKLGGSDRFGMTNGAGGGWANQNGVDVIALCVFPDLSAIDSQALLDHAAGFNRGADLEPLMRYKLNQSPKPFQTP